MCCPTESGTSGCPCDNNPEEREDPPPTAVASTVSTSITSDDGLELKWSLNGLAPNSGGGIHIHYGTSCESETTVTGDAPTGANKGHYYVPDATPDPSEDPWSLSNWKSDADGNAASSVVISASDLGDTASSAYSRVVIVHDASKAKIGCGVLAPYSPTTVTGTVDATITEDGKLKLNWSLNGLDENSDGGIHIHYGNTCQSEATVKGDAPTGANKGHYYVPASPYGQRVGFWDPPVAALNGEDPWSIKWDSGAQGNAADSAEFTETQLGAPVKSAFNRVVIVHNNAGKKVGCGVLKSTDYSTYGYELGDLSGRNGNAKCDNGEGIFRVTDTNPPHNVDFIGQGNQFAGQAKWTSAADLAARGAWSSASGTGQGNQFASIVFHKASTGAKYFGVALEKVH